MPLMQCVLPMAFSQDASSPDQMFRNMTFLFGLYSMYSPFNAPNSGDLSDLIIRPGKEPGAICARSGNWFPGESLTTDGQGRTVGKQFYTEGLAVPNIPPFPVFSKSP